MREIKFKAWNSVDAEMVDVGAIAWHSNVFDTRDYTHGSNPHFYDTNGMLHLIEDCKFLQYIGLKDINGKEIFESDILKDSEGDVYPIDWNSNYACFDARGFFDPCQDIPYDIFSSKAYSCMEVVGNIYENEDLLRGANI